MRMLLICCEGKTEQFYFDIIARQVLRIPGYRGITILGEKGQHRALIDKTCSERQYLAEKHNLDIEEVETWAVCDDDGMKMHYAELEEYAAENNVYLAFSRPQFEAYLIQHFEQSKAVKKQDLFAALSRHRQKIDGKEFTEKSKTDLSWMATALIDKPKLLKTAVTNADQRTAQSGDLFLTVQHLTRRLMALERS